MGLVREGCGKKELRCVCVCRMDEHRIYEGFKAGSADPLFLELKTVYAQDRAFVSSQVHAHYQTLQNASKPAREHIASVIQVNYFCPHHT